MNKNIFALLFGLSFIAITASPVYELEQMIIKSDIESVKKLLPTIEPLDLKLKSRLIELANDIILKRLKAIEFIGFNYYFTSAEEIYSKEEIEKIKCFYARINKLFSRSFKSMGVGLILGIIVSILEGINSDQNSKFSSSIKDLLGLGSVTCFGAGCVEFIYALIVLTKDFYLTGNNINLRITKLYNDAILIKQLLYDIEITIPQKNDLLTI